MQKTGKNLSGKIVTFILLITCLTACENGMKDKLDRKLSLDYNEYEKNLLHSPAKESILKSKTEPIIPKLSKIITKPKTQSVAEDKLVSISITEDVPIKDVLIELSRSANIDVEIDKDISGGIIFSAKDRPFMEVIDRIADQANLRYEIANGILKLMRDAPYMVNYPLDFIDMVRSSRSSASVNTALGASDGGTSSFSDSASTSAGSGASLSSGSSTSLSSSYSGDLWSQINRDISTIIRPQTTVAPQAPGSSAVARPYVLFNQQAGIISLFADMRTQKQVADYLNKVRQTATSQVLIEAKFVEVSLDDKYRTGINWSKIDPGKLGFLGDFDSSKSGLATEGISDLFEVGRFTKTGSSLSTSTDLEALVSLVQVFGTTRTLSSPRINAMNNQQAILSFVRNEVFFELEIETTTSGTTDVTSQTDVTSTRQTVPIGVILSLQPSINENTQEVTMNIRPTISRVVSTVSDPAVAFVIASNNNLSSGDVQSQIPVVEIKELDSIMKIKSGDVMVIGGLMEERQTNTDSGAPFAMQIPFVGNLFKSVSKTTDIIQTVIFVKATIVPNNFMYDTDIDFYDKFFKERDPLPLNLIKKDV